MKFWFHTKTSAIFLGVALTAFSCQKDTTVEPTDKTVVQNVEEHLEFLQMEEGIPDRLALVNLPVVLTETDFGRSACPKEAIWAHVGEIATLNHAGKNLSATHVAISGNLALVSYHLRGEEHLGAVEVVDLSNPIAPKITSQIIFLQADVNAIAIEESNTIGGAKKVWVAMSDAKNGAVVGELSLNGKKFESSTYRNIKLAYNISGQISPAANAIAQSDDLLYVTAGRSNGGVFAINKSDLSLAGVKQFPNAKGVAVSDSKVACLQAADDNATLFLDKPGAFSFEDKYSISKFEHQNVDNLYGGKAALNFSADGNILYVAAGATGVRAIDINSGKEVFESPAEMLVSGNSNGVSSDDQYVYAANGADGLAIFTFGTDGLPDPSHVFLWDLDEKNASANFVASNGDWIFVAKGQGGFKILKKPSPADVLSLCAFDGKGKPNCLVADQPICEKLLPELNAKLPINGNINAQNANYLTKGESEILLTEDTEIMLTFLEENTNQTHAVGYYAYPADCPPSNAADLVGLIAFPNFSKSGSDGSLVPGSTVKLHNSFKANTKIGFFLVPKGWDGSKVKAGQNLFYTNKAFSQNSRKQGLIIYEDSCDAIVVAFEQSPSNSSQADFREAVMQVHISSPTAVDKQTLLQF